MKNTMVRRKIRMILVICLIINMLFCFQIKALTPKLSQSNNIKFIEYFSEYNNSSAALGKKEVVPNPISITNKSISNYRKSSNLPQKYDSRDYDRVTTVKNQGSIGACWAFASTATLESFLLSSDKGEFDLSENNIITNHGFSLDPDNGGNMIMATAYYARWQGPVAEEEDPYPEIKKPENVVVRQTNNVENHIQEVVFIPGRSFALDNDDIKKAIMDYGAVDSTMYIDNGYLNNSTNAYYYNGSYGANHEVAIIGWDDTYSANNFSNKPLGDGAFIIKNSYGTSWGENGFAYVSYYDNVIGAENSVFIAEEKNNYDNIYQYDPYGITGQIGYGNDTAWFANVFTFSGDERQRLGAVSFYTTKKNANYEIYYSSYSVPEDNYDASKLIASGVISMPGYHTIKLEKNIVIPEIKNFTIAVKLNVHEETNPITIEHKVFNYSDKASANLGESYISYDGVSWEDLNIVFVDNNGNHPNMNVNLKAFTKDINPYDLNSDGLIDILDISLIGIDFNKKSTDENFNDWYDLNDDKIIDIFDLVKISNSIT